MKWCLLVVVVVNTKTLFPIYICTLPAFRAVDQHSFFADPAVLLKADPDPAVFLMRIRNQEGKWMRILANPDPQPSLHCKTKYRRNKKCPTWGSSWPRPWWAVCRPWAAWGRWTCPPRWAPRWPLGSSCQYQTQHSWTAVAGSGSWS